jgi:hypothetical protein
LASHDAESTAGSGEPTTTTNVGIAGFLGATPQVFLIIALGLAVIGILFRIVLTIAAARRARLVLNQPASDRAESQGPDDWRDDQDEFGWTDRREAKYPPVSTASDYGATRLFQTDGACLDSTWDLNEISKRDDTLGRLRQEIDHLLQFEWAGQPQRSRHDEQKR